MEEFQLLQKKMEEENEKLTKIELMTQQLSEKKVILEGEINQQENKLSD